MCLTPRSCVAAFRSFSSANAARTSPAVAAVCTPTTWSRDDLSPVACPISLVQAVEGTRASLTAHRSIRTHTWHPQSHAHVVPLY